MYTLLFNTFTISFVVEEQMKIYLHLPCSDLGNVNLSSDRACLSISIFLPLLYVFILVPDPHVFITHLIKI